MASGSVGASSRGAVVKVHLTLVSIIANLTVADVASGEPLGPPDQRLEEEKEQRLWEQLTLQLPPFIQGSPSQKSMTSSQSVPV